MKIKIVEILMFFTFISLYILNVKSGSTNIVSIVLILILFFTVIMILYKYNKKLIFSKIFIWYLIFSTYSVFSFVFSINPQNSIKLIPTFSINLILIFVITNYIDSSKKLLSVMKLILLCGFINSIILVFTSNYSTVDTYNRVGYTMGNVNLIAIQICYSLIFAIFLFYLFGKQKNYKNKYLLMILLMTIAILFTGARQVFIMLCVFTFLQLFLKDYNNIFRNLRNIVIAIIIIMIMFYLIMKNDFLYMLLGSRIEEMFNMLLGKNVVEYSLNSRSNMIRLGIEWFKSNPILGYGIDTYKVMYNNMFGINYYAHNNYIEILVDLGLIGIIIYYFYYIAALVKLWKFKLYKNYDSCIIFCLLFSQLVLDFAFVSYYSRILIIVLSIIDRYIYIKKQEKGAINHEVSFSNNVNL